MQSGTLELAGRCAPSCKVPPTCARQQLQGCNGLAGWEPSPVSARYQCGSNGDQRRGCRQSLLFPMAMAKKPLLAVVAQVVQVTTQHSIAPRGTTTVTSRSGHLGPVWSGLVWWYQTSQALIQAWPKPIPLSDGVVCPSLTRGEETQGTSTYSPSKAQAGAFAGLDRHSGRASPQ